MDHSNSDVAEGEEYNNTSSSLEEKEQLSNAENVDNEAQQIIKDNNLIDMETGSTGQCEEHTEVSQLLEVSPGGLSSSDATSRGEHVPLKAIQTSHFDSPLTPTKLCDPSVEDLEATNAVCFDKLSPPPEEWSEENLSFSSTLTHLSGEQFSEEKEFKIPSVPDEKNSTDSVSPDTLWKLSQFEKFYRDLSEVGTVQPLFIRFGDTEVCYKYLSQYLLLWIDLSIG